MEIENVPPPMVMVLANTLSARSYPGASSRLPSWVRLVNERVRAIVSPRKMKSVPSVTMNDGNLVVTTRNPLKTPMARASTRATAIAGHRFHPKPP